MYEFHVTFNFCDHGVSQLFLMMFTIVHMNLMLLWFALRMFEDIHHWCLPIAFHHDVHHSLNSMFIWIFSNVEVLFQLWKKLSQDLLYWCFPIGSHHDLGHHWTYVCMNSILLLLLSMTIVSQSCFSPWSSALWEFHFRFFSDDDDDESHLWILILWEVKLIVVVGIALKWWNSRHAHTLLELIPIVSLCSCVRMIASPHTHTKYRSPFLLPTADMVVRCCAACSLLLDFKAQEKHICSIHKHRL